MFCFAETGVCCVLLRLVCVVFCCVWGVCVVFCSVESGVYFVLLCMGGLCCVLLC